MNKLGIYDIQYWASVNGGPYQPLNFPGPKTHIVIKRTRKRAIRRAAFMDHTGYEWSQWWHRKASKPKRWEQ